VRSSEMRLPLEGEGPELIPPLTRHGAQVFVGTSGFRFPDWKGHFYPESVKEKDWLAYYGQRFNCLEINSSYYRQNTPATYARMIERVPAGFQFAVKAFRTLTHEAGSDNEQDFRVFVDSLQPFLEADEFACVLAQFPTSFHNTPDNRHYLAEFQDRFANLPLVVEFRGREWVDEAVFGFLREHKVGFCAVDEPKLAALMPPVAVATSDLGYVRFHGRNAANWWKPTEGKDRYDYHYSKEELEEWVPKIDQVAEETSKIYIFMNNCFQGQAAANAMDIRGLLEIS
jgi:uncharacterized protein YecE (DUF72 family)